MTPRPKLFASHHDAKVDYFGGHELEVEQVPRVDTAIDRATTLELRAVIRRGARASDFSPIDLGHAAVEAIIDFLWDAT